MSSSRKRILKCAGATVAYLIGSGFASGQEVMQFFTAYGPVRSGLGGLLTLAILVIAAAWVLRDARRLQMQDVNEIFRYYCGRYLGTFFEWLTPLFLFGIYVIMLAGASSLLSEYFGLAPIVGRVLMLALSLSTVLLGLEKLTKILGAIGPFIIAFIILLGVVCVGKQPQNILLSASLAPTLSMTKATPYWWLSGITYATFCFFTLVPFLAGIGPQLQNDKECRSAALFGAGSFVLTAVVLSYGILSQLNVLYNKSVPTVYMADSLLPGLGAFFSLILLAGIYTTAVPMLWTSCNKLVKEDKSRKFRLVACLLGVIAFFGGRLPFSTLINLIYPFMGYFGIVVFCCVAYRQLRPGALPTQKVSGQS